MKQELNVLVIDDDSLDRRRLARVLHNTGLNVSIQEAADATSGIELFRSTAFDCVFLDYRLPDIDGPEALERLLAIEDRGVPNVIALTGSMGHDKAEEMVRAGAADYLTKSELSPTVVRRSLNYATARREFIDALDNERTQTIEDLQNLDRMKSEFVSTVSHELRTPLTAMRSALGLVADETLGPLSDDQTEYVHLVQRNLERLSELLNDLLDFSRLEAGKLPVNMGNHDIAGLIRESVAVMADRAREKNCRVLVDIPDQAIIARCDPNRTIQVLVNLISNAIRHNPEGTTIAVTPRRSKGRIVVGVKDDGVGIAPDDQQKLFNCFYQVERTEGAGSRGTGLGLAITLRLMEIQGGTIRLDSEKGRGSEFSVDFDEAEVPHWERHGSVAYQIDDLEIEVADYGDRVVVTPLGTIPPSACQILSQVMTECIDRGISLFVFDFGRCAAIDERALGLLIEWRARAMSAGGNVALLPVSDQVKDALMYVGLLDTIPSYATMSDAFASLSELPRTRAAQADSPNQPDPERGD